MHKATNCIGGASQQVNWTKHYYILHVAKITWLFVYNVYTNLFFFLHRIIYVTVLQFPDIRNQNLTLDGSIVQLPIRSNVCVAGRAAIAATVISQLR